MISLISTLFVAVVTSVGIIAYRHPKSYARLYWFLMPASSVAFAYAIGHNIGFYDSEATMLQFVPHPVDWQRVNAALADRTFHYYHMIYYQVAVWVYLTILVFLPRIISDRAASAKGTSKR